MRRKIAAGNWKMNGTLLALTELMSIAGNEADNAEVIVCPPATLISQAADAAQNTNLSIGGQDCHAKESGAFTGDISAEMLADLGASHVIVGHSERREYHKESDAEVRVKAEAAYRAGLTAIICVGETLEEREAGKAEEIVGSQLKGSIPDAANGENTIIAYEPVWAIGTGKVPSSADIAQMHAFIRANIPDAEKMRVLYGGSCKASNAAELFAIENVDGGLVGGASLKADDFIPIIAAANEA